MGASPLGGHHPKGADQWLSWSVMGGCRMADADGNNAHRRHLLESANARASPSHRTIPSLPILAHPSRSSYAYCCHHFHATQSTRLLALLFSLWPSVHQLFFSNNEISHVKVDTCCSASPVRPSDHGALKPSFASSLSSCSTSLYIVDLLLDPRTLDPPCIPEESSLRHFTSPHLGVVASDIHARVLLALQIQSSERPFRVQRQENGKREKEERGEGMG